MKKFIALLAVIIVATNTACAMKPYHGSVIHQWDKQFEISKGIVYCSNLGKEKPSTIYLSRLPEPIQPIKPLNINVENPQKEVAQPDQNATQKAAPSEENAKQGGNDSGETAWPIAMEFYYPRGLSQHHLDLPTLEELYCISDLWRCLLYQPPSCSSCRD